ncbi:NADH-quinone oxidoreductase subunit H [Solidesulfovibrio sp.]|uniref:respiratory chain complex I subunit 1 family protein n=1 Tax=Solidesulfovibrio sp. TaxID=2910990 RepID=UPI0026263580|nr:NADH-quinone oxidoreductase subunit H [Solidesulfovibrio sp.]
MHAYLHLALALVLAPLIPGIVNRVKARVAGRAGKPVLQTYFDLAKLVRKGVVTSTTASWAIFAGPVASLAAVGCALLLVPGPATSAPVSFAGDFMFLAYLLGLSRLALILSALDTGSSFEGMGASREAVFSALAEPVLFLCFLSLAADGTGLSLDSLLAVSDAKPLGAAHLFVPAILFVLLLVENCRIPVDDPNTHLELTMIHEVMVLDHSGPDMAAVVYGASLKLWLFCALTVLSVMPRTGLSPVAAWGVFLAGMALAAVAVGLVESAMARLRLTRVPRLLGGAGALVALSLVLSVWR